MKKVVQIIGGILAGFILIIFIIGTVGLKPFHIPSGSMIPTLLIGDHLFVSKMAYNSYFGGTEPKLGDVAAFRSEVEPRTNFIRRVVGLPGDRLQMKEGILYINDVPCPLEPHGEFQTVDDDGTVLKAPQYLETFPNGLKHLILKKEPFGKGPYDNTPVFTVPSGHYFVMGDNRDASNDSRVQGLIGYIPLKNFVGQASIVYFSVEGMENILRGNSEHGLQQPHYNRIGQVIR